MADIVIYEAKPVKVGGIDAPWHVTTETVREESEESSFHNRTLMRLYRGETEIYAVEWRYLSEVDSAKAALLRVVSLYEGYRIQALATIEALREAGAAEEVVRQVTPAGFGA
jgi:hypothetical protein